MPYFRRHLGELRLVWPTSPDEPALRAAQLGALLSLSGHLQTSEEAAQAVLPTGVGKTAVLCGLPFLIPSTRVLVTVPTRLLRDQIADEFRSLATLKLGALPEDFPTPAVRRIDHRLGTADAWAELEAVDVAVGTPAVLSALIEGVATPPEGIFDLLLFDEAHHLPAKTWEGIYAQHNQRAALLTATPFRRDRKHLPGSLTYHYSLRQAIEAGVYSPVSFVPVEAGTNPDQAIAETAVARLRDPQQAEDGSLLLVRTDRVNHAEELVELYGADGVRLGIITARQSARTVRRTVEHLRAGELDGVASVGALVEGFDLPKLKIAAYHRPHRTLPPTLQFIGRIARITGGQAPAELVAIRQAVTSETAELYREDVAWTQLLPQLADAAVLRERETRRYLADAQISGPEELSASALAPRRLVQIFDTTHCDAIDLQADVPYLSFGRVVFRFTDADAALLALITGRLVRPPWLNSDALDFYEHHLALAANDAARQLLYISAPSVSAATQLREAIGAREATRIPPQLVARYLWASRVSSYSSVGMSNTRAAARQAAYRMLAGSAVEQAISLAEARGYGLGHVIGLREQGRELRGMGVSVKKSKIWETAPADSLLEFREWCDELGAAIRTPIAEATAAPNIQLRLPDQLEAFPPNPIAAFLDNRMARGGTRLLTDGQTVDLASVQVVVERPSDTQLRLRLGFDDGDLWVGDIHTDGSVRGERDDGLVELPNGDRQTLVELLTDYPPTFYFANGSSASGTVVFEPLHDLPVPESVFDVWDWTTTDIGNEAGETQEGAVNVQVRTLEYVTATLHDPIVIVDHGAYELADVIAIEQTENIRRAHLFHCKASSQAQPGARLADLYDVIGQAIRSARWSAPSLLWRELARRVEQRPGLTVVDRDREQVQQMFEGAADTPLDTQLHVWVVQPGLSRQAMETWAEGRTIIANAFDWCQDMPAELTLAVSP
jgi:superfamily II DNA or RNA helicase